MLNPVIYYRPGKDVPEEEVDAMLRHFPCYTSRMQVPAKSLCIARYSALPYYKELETDLLYIGSKLINTWKQHRYVADLGNWVGDLEGLTPKTYRRLEEVPNSAFPLVVKGETNGKKFLWDTHCFAATRQAAAEVTCRLQDDGLINGQWMYYRQFVPLKTYLTSFHGLPISKEFRVFVCNQKVLSKGYYWSNHLDDLPEVPDPNDIPEAWLNEVIARIGDSVTFYAVDVAQTATGDWTVIELNDGQQSGLSDNNPDVLYQSLKQALT